MRRSSLSRALALASVMSLMALWAPATAQAREIGPAPWLRWEYAASVLKTRATPVEGVTQEADGITNGYRITLGGALTERLYLHWDLTQFRGELTATRSERADEDPFEIQGLTIGLGASWRMPSDWWISGAFQITELDQGGAFSGEPQRLAGGRAGLGYTWGIFQKWELNAGAELAMVGGLADLTHPNGSNQEARWHVSSLSLMLGIARRVRE